MAIKWKPKPKEKLVALCDMVEGETFIDPGARDGGRVYMVVDRRETREQLGTMTVILSSPSQGFFHHFKDGRKEVEPVDILMEVVK